MKTLMIIVLAAGLGICAHLVACNASSDLSEELPGGYFYINEGAEHQMILNHSGTGVGIYGRILRYKSKNGFIVVVQQPNRVSHLHTISFYARESLTNSSEDKSIADSKHIADSILTNDPYYVNIFSRKRNYWIIDTRSTETYGPFSFEEFKTKHDALGLPKSLLLKE